MRCTVRSYALNVDASCSLLKGMTALSMEAMDCEEDHLPLATIALLQKQSKAHHMTKRLKQRMAKKRVMKSTSQVGDCRQNLTIQMASHAERCCAKVGALATLSRDPPRPSKFAKSWT